MMIAQLDPDYLRTRPTKLWPRLVSHFIFQGRFATTQHRWLNNITLPLLKFMADTPTYRRVPDPIFVIGTGRSGSTILGKVLSIHHALAFLNEPKALWYAIDPADDIHHHFGTGQARYRWTPAQATQRHVRRAHRLYRSYLNLSWSKRVLEKNPDMTFRARFLRQLFPDARFLFLVRDGEQTVASIAHWSQRHRINKHAIEDWWGVDNHKWQLLLNEIAPSEPLLANHLKELESENAEINKAAVEWIVTVQEGLQLLREFPEQVMLIPYEELVRSPAETLRAVCRFCALSEDPTFLAYGERTLQATRNYPAVELANYLHSAFKETIKDLEEYQQLKKQ